MEMSGAATVAIYGKLFPPPIQLVRRRLFAGGRHFYSNWHLSVLTR